MTLAAKSLEIFRTKCPRTRVACARSGEITAFDGDRIRLAPRFDTRCWEPTQGTSIWQKAMGPLSALSANWTLTGLEEISDDLPETDFWPAWLF